METVTERDPLVVSIQRHSLDDGPGIRTVVFFKGCPLACRWCQNPEAISPRRQLKLDAVRCVRCGACGGGCLSGRSAPRTDPPVRPMDCLLCGGCVDACPTGAREIVGTSYPEEELERLLVEDEPFYRHSGGGVTFSGGEPTMHLRFAGRLAGRLRRRGIHVLLETAGCFELDELREHLLPHLCTVYFDVKLADPADHRRHTGVGNERIIENLRHLSRRSEVVLLPRVPLVPGVTDTAVNLDAIARLLAGIGLEQVALLPYNPTWLSKRLALGMSAQDAPSRWMTEDEIRRCREPFLSRGLRVSG